ncbi:tetratricopeptide repeat protein [Pseudoalteromonas sp. OOF1S-7]|uniref:tetratricopeptide repeat protein n=1 Tax=Pseudoalteromonas sp. OOF1S-7 TaxID=2917757 RepID=UPI001EF5D773|nr:tetratricopeptide repeat protein [Pseudoalteromonas sp. OOF1S-7]MCG7535494.1 sel1 repeat family protein [Pseudoalteromonas sp. OOF1S-7]
MSEHNPELTPEIQALTEKAQSGDAEAQYELGDAYYFGDDTEQNYEQAAYWFKQAAKQDHAEAQFSLGFMYQDGQGLEQSDEKAIDWYNQAAERGNANAQCNLGFIFEHGRGLEQSDEQAVKYYQQAAEQGDARGQCNLGVMYQYGQGVEQSDQQAVKYYRLAAKQKDARGQSNLGAMYELGKGVRKNIAKAVEYYELAAAQKDTRALLNLAYCYFDGKGVDQSYSETKALCEKIFKDPLVSFEAYELHDRAERFELSESIGELREQILDILKIGDETPMTHYTSYEVGQAILLEKSPFRLGHINAVNDPNEGKLLWHALGFEPIEGNPVFIGCFLPKSDSLNMWRFYSKNHLNDDACGCAITFNTRDFFDYRLLAEKGSFSEQSEAKKAFANTGQSPQESAAFYRVLYVKGQFEFEEEDEEKIGSLFANLKEVITAFVGKNPTSEKLQDLAWLLGPLPYLLKDANYKDEQEHRVIVTHLEYGAKEIQSSDPDFATGTAPRLYLELHRDNHLAPIEYVTLGPKAPNKEMMAPYWRHQLASKFTAKLDIRPSRCAYK